MFEWVAWCWLVFGIYAAASHLDLKILKPDTKGRSVNLALETVVEFDNQDKAENIKFLDNVNKLIGKVKTAITNNDKARREFSDASIEKFTDFIQKAIDVLNDYSDNDLEAFFAVLNDEVRNYHYRGCKFNELIENNELKSFLTAKLDAAKNVKVSDIRETLATLSDKIEEEKYDKFERNLVDFVDSLYRKDSIDKLKKFLNYIVEFKYNKGSYSDLVRVIKEGLRSCVFDHYTNLNNNARVELKTKIDEFWDNYSKLNTHDNKYKTTKREDFVNFRYPKTDHHYTTTKLSKERYMNNKLKQVHVKKVKYNPTLFTTTTTKATTMKKLTFMTLYPEFETHWPGFISETKRPRFKSQLETNRPRIKSEDHKPKLQIEMKLRKGKGKHKTNTMKQNIELIPQKNAFMDFNDHRDERFEILLPKRLNQDNNTNHRVNEQSSESTTKHKNTSKRPISIGYLTEKISDTIKKKLSKLSKRLETEHTSKYLEEMPKPKTKLTEKHFRSRDNTMDDMVLARIQNLESELQNVKTQLENDTELINNLKNKVIGTDSRRIESGLNKYYHYEANSKTTENAYFGGFGFSARIAVEPPKKIYKAKKYTNKLTRFKNNYHAKDINQMKIKSDIGKGNKHRFVAKKYTNNLPHLANVYKQHVPGGNENKYKKYQLRIAKESNDKLRKALNKFENHRNEKYHDNEKVDTVSDLDKDNFKLDHKKSYYMQPWFGPRTKQYRFPKRQEYHNDIYKNKAYKSPNLDKKYPPSIEKKYHDDRQSKAEIKIVSDTETQSAYKNRYNANNKYMYGSNKYTNDVNHEKRKAKTSNKGSYRKMINNDEMNRIENKEIIQEPYRGIFEKYSDKKSYKDRGKMKSDLDKAKNYDHSNEESYKNEKDRNYNDGNEIYNEEEYIDKYSKSSEKEIEKTYDTAAERSKNDLEGLNDISNEIPIEHSRKHFKQNDAGIVKNYYSVKEMFSKNDNEKAVNIRNGNNSKADKYETDIHTTKQVSYTTKPTIIIATDKSLEHNNQPLIKSQTDLYTNKNGDNDKKYEMINKTEISYQEIPFDSNEHVLPSDVRKVNDISRDSTTKEIIYKTYTDKNTAHNNIDYDIHDNRKDRLKDIQYAPVKSIHVSQYTDNQTNHEENNNKNDIITKTNNAEVTNDNTTTVIKEKYSQDKCNKSSCTNNKLEKEISKQSLRKDIDYKSDIVKDNSQKEKYKSHVDEDITQNKLAHTKNIDNNEKFSSKQYERMTFGLNKRFKKVSRVTDSYSKVFVYDVTEKDKQIKHKKAQHIEKIKDNPTKEIAEKYDHVQRANEKALANEMDSNQKYSVHYEKIFDVDDPLFKKTSRLYETDKNVVTDIEKQNDDKDNYNIEVKYQSEVKNIHDIHNINGENNYNTLKDINNVTILVDDKMKLNVKPDIDTKVDNNAHQITGLVTDKMRVEFKNDEILVSNNSNSNIYQGNNDIDVGNNIKEMTDHGDNMFVESNRKSGGPVEDKIENDNNQNHNNSFENEKIVGHLKAEISPDVLKALEVAAQSHEDMNYELKPEINAKQNSNDYRNANGIHQYFSGSDKKGNFVKIDDRRETDLRKNIDASKLDTRISELKDENTKTKTGPSENYKDILKDNSQSDHLEPQAKLYQNEIQGKANRRFSNHFESDDKYKGIDNILGGPKIEQADLEAHMNDIWESMNRTGYTDKMPDIPIRMTVSNEVLQTSDSPPFFEKRKVFAPTAPAPLTTKKLELPTANTEFSLATLFPLNDEENKKELTITDQTLSPTDNLLQATNINEPLNLNNILNNDFNLPKSGAVPPAGFNEEISIPGVDSLETLKSRVSDRLNLPKSDLKTAGLDSFLNEVGPLNMDDPAEVRRNLFTSHTETHREVHSKEIFEDPTLKDMDKDMLF